jgi:hypothetical protein
VGSAVVADFEHRRRKGREPRTQQRGDVSTQAVSSVA